MNLVNLVNRRARPAARLVLPAMALAAAVVAAGCGVSDVESAETYPTRPVEVVVPYPAGGGADVLARALVEAVNDGGDLDETLQIVNRDGGGGVVGAADVLAAEPDGYTLGLAPEGPITLQPEVVEVPYEPLDLTPLVQVSRGPAIIAVAGGSPYRTIEDLLTAARRAPGTVGMGEGPLSYAVPTAQLERAAEVSFRRVDFEGDAASTTAILGNNIEATMTQAAAILPQVQAGDIRALAVTGPERLPSLPDVPTLAELDIDVVSEAVYGVFGPAGLPEDIAEKLSGAFEDALDSESFTTAAESLGLPVVPADGAALMDYYRERTEEVGELADSGELS